MLCIPDSSTNSWISNQLLELGYSYSWIGYSDLPNKDGNYKWVSGCSSSYTYWDVNSNYNNYDCAYIASDGFWGSTSDVGSNRTICICEYNLEPTSLPTIVPSAPTANSSTISPTYNQNTSSSSSPTTTTTKSSSSSTSSSISVGLIILIVLGSIHVGGYLLIFLCGYGGKKDVKVDIAQTYPDGEDGYGNISSSFPVTSSNHEFQVATTNEGYEDISPSFPTTSSSTQGQGYGNIAPSFPTNSNYNQEYGNSSYSFPATSSNQEYGYGYISPSFPVTSSNQGFPVTSSNQEYGDGNVYPFIPVTSSNQGYGSNATSYPVTSSNQENGYGSIE